jgi:hypothetical protein
LVRKRKGLSLRQEIWNRIYACCWLPTICLLIIWLPMHHVPAPPEARRSRGFRLDTQTLYVRQSSYLTVNHCTWESVDSIRSFSRDMTPNKPIRKSDLFPYQTMAILRRESVARDEEIVHNGMRRLKNGHHCTDVPPGHEHLNINRIKLHSLMTFIWAYSVYSPLVALHTLLRCSIPAVSIKGTSWNSWVNFHSRIFECTLSTFSETNPSSEFTLFLHRTRTDLLRSVCNRRRGICRRLKRNVNEIWWISDVA